MPAWTHRALTVALLLGGCGGDDAATSAGGRSSRAPAATAPTDTGPAWPSWGPTIAPIDPQTERALLAAELDRDTTAAAIAEAFASGDEAITTRAAWSLARIGGPDAAERFAEMLYEGEPTLPAGVFAAIAALEPPAPVSGSLVLEQPWAELAERLWHHYAVEERSDRAIAMLLAISRIGGPTSHERLGVDLSAIDPADPQRAVRALDAMAILCRRGFGLSAEPFAVLSSTLASSVPEVRHAAAATLGRCAGPSAEQLAGEGRADIAARLSEWVTDADDAQAHAGWIGLAAIGELPAQTPATILGDAPPPWRTEVAAVRALATTADGRTTLVERLAKIDPVRVQGPRWHAVLEALRGLRPAVDAAPELVDTLSPLADRLADARDSADARRRKASTLAACELKVLQAITSKSVAGLDACAAGADAIPDTFGVKLAIDAWTAMPASPEKADALLALARDERSGVAAAALSALAEIDDDRVSATLREALGGEDVGRISAAAGAIAGRAVDRQRRDPDAVAPLVAAVRRLTNDAAVEARIAAIDALGNLARSAREPEAVDPDTAPTVPAADEAATPWLGADVLGLATDPNAAVRAAARRAVAHDAELRGKFDARVPKSFPNGFARKVHAAADAPATQTLTLQTDAGAIVIDLRGAPTPIAHGTFAALAESGYFDGLTFHRVVPDFVIQGGDPRGDGYGGPGYVMPCEWSNLRYERGTVGIALAGKDTGGSQLFITHGRPMHLDARYSVIGHVTEGLDAVDAMLPFDRIVSVTVE